MGIWYGMKIWCVNYSFAYSILSDPCSEQVKQKCRENNQEICQRGSGECGACLDGYTLRANTGICERKYLLLVIALGFVLGWCRVMRSDAIAFRVWRSQSRSVLFTNWFGWFFSLKCRSQSVWRCGQRGLSKCQQRDLWRRCVALGTNRVWASG